MTRDPNMCPSIRTDRLPANRDGCRHANRANGLRENDRCDLRQ
jgi:hypothetical protein